MDLESHDPNNPVLTNRQTSLPIRDIEHLIVYKEHNHEMPFLPKGGELYVFHPKTDAENRDWVADGHR